MDEGKGRAVITGNLNDTREHQTADTTSVFILTCSAANTGFYDDFKVMEEPRYSAQDWNRLMIRENQQASNYHRRLCNPFTRANAAPVQHMHHHRKPGAPTIRRNAWQRRRMQILKKAFRV
jgi:hypothetical protein